MITKGKFGNEINNIHLQGQSLFSNLSKMVARIDHK